MALFRRTRKPTGKPGEWYYCLEHGKVEEGPECPAKNRMGPYTSRADAEHALQTVADRNEEWDNDSRWRDRQGEGEGDRDEKR